MKRLSNTTPVCLTHAKDILALLYAPVLAAALAAQPVQALPLAATDVVVDLADVDTTTHRGMLEFDRRVTDAAASICDRLGDAAESCVSEARRKAAQTCVRMQRCTLALRPARSPQQ